MAWDVNEEYFSGQGSVLVGYRDENGQPEGLRHIGNVSALTLSTAISYNNHKESKTGNRSTDRRTISETNVTWSATCENFSSENLKMFLRAQLLKVPAGAVTDTVVNGVSGLITPLEHLKVSNVVVKQGATTLQAYVNESTPYDYEVNEEGGSIKLSETSTKLGNAVSDIVVGATTTITAAGIKGIYVGDVITVTGVTGADAESINGVPLTVKAVTPTGVVVDFDTTAKVFVAAAALLTGGTYTLSVSYDYEDQDRLEAMTAPERDVWIRFEGLNTSEENAPVTVDVFRSGVTPLQDLALISDEIQASQVSGDVFVDTKRKAGSKYYVVRK